MIFSTAAQSVLSCRDNVFGRVHGGSERGSKRIKRILRWLQKFSKTQLCSFLQASRLTSSGVLKNRFSQQRFPLIDVATNDGWNNLMAILKSSINSLLLLRLPSGMPAVVETICHLSWGKGKVAPCVSCQFLQGYIKRQMVVKKTQPIYGFQLIGLQAFLFIWDWGRWVLGGLEIQSAMLSFENHVMQ